jgi:hypothetical protein
LLLVEPQKFRIEADHAGQRDIRSDGVEIYDGGRRAVELIGQQPHCSIEQA